jgi:hypothetical protein
VISVQEPRPVVGREHDAGLFVDAVLLQRSDDLSDAPINFADYIDEKS